MLCTVKLGEKQMKRKDFFDRHKYKILLSCTPAPLYGGLQYTYANEYVGPEIEEEITFTLREISAFITVLQVCVEAAVYNMDPEAYILMQEFRLHPDEG